MMLLLATLPQPTGPELLTWLSCAVLVLGIALLIKNLFFSGLPQPLRTQRETRMATWEEVQSLRRDFERFSGTLTAQHEQLEEKLDTLRSETLKAGLEREGRIHERIDGLAASINKLIGLWEGRNSASIHP